MPSAHTSEPVAAARRALGHRLAVLRRAAGYSQQSFASLIGYGRSTVANVETGRQNAPRAFWVRCQQLLGETTLTSAYDEVQEIVAAMHRAAADDAQADREASVTAWRRERAEQPRDFTA